LLVRAISPAYTNSNTHLFSTDRKKVLKHHPDKKASTTTTEAPSTILGLNTNQNTNDDAFFKCIQKAHEVLTNSEKRRQFDSVDPEFLETEEDITGVTAAEFKVTSILCSSELVINCYAFQAKTKDFFTTFAPIFTLYQRFSRSQPVPGLGALDATKEEVEGFYDFWYNFDSWRSFEWWDKEVNEGSDRWAFGLLLLC
jgi:DnaJ family protein C protein 2